MLINLETVEKQLDGISKELAEKYVIQCGLQVERKAKKLCPKDTGDLARSIRTELIGENEVAVGTDVNYAIWVHEGTGLYAKGETSRPKGTYWIYIKKPNGEYDTYKEDHPGQSKIYYNLDDAKRAMRFLNELGLDAHITQGREPNPFLTNALHEEAPNLDIILNQIIKEAL